MVRKKKKKKKKKSLTFSQAKKAHLFVKKLSTNGS